MSLNADKISRLSANSLANEIYMNCNPFNMKLVLIAIYNPVQLDIHIIYELKGDHG